MIERVRDEVSKSADPEEQAEEAREFLAAFALRDAYRRLMRGLAESGGGTAGSGLSVATTQAYRALDAQLGAIVSDERAEVENVLLEVGEYRQQLRVYALGAVLLAVVAAVLAATFALRFILAPLDVLDAGSRELASGNIAHRIALRGPRELAQLSARLNTMAGRLEEQRGALRDANTDLERTVRDRTRELAEKAQRLQAIDESRRLFFAKVGHELRTPLTVMLGEAEVALQSRESDPQVYEQALEFIRANGENLKRRIADLLAVARSEDGTLQIHRGDVDLCELLRLTVAQLQSFARSNDVRLEAVALPGSLMVRADADWVRQAVMALIDNAIKYSPPSGLVQVVLQSTRSKVAILVKDEGAGVDEKELPLIAAPYFQGAGAPSLAGTGLGLAVARWVAEQHGGALTAANGSDGGLEVSLLLPLEA
jgi:signal transduction histidine kinase